MARAMNTRNAAVTRLGGGEMTDKIERSIEELYQNDPQRAEYFSFREAAPPQDEEAPLR